MTNYREFRRIVTEHKSDSWERWRYSDRVAALALNVIAHIDKCEQCRAVFDQLYAGEHDSHKPLKDMETFVRVEEWISCNTKQ